MVKIYDEQRTIKIKGSDVCNESLEVYQDFLKLMKDKNFEPHTIFFIGRNKDGSMMGNVCEERYSDVLKLFNEDVAKLASHIFKESECDELTEFLKGMNNHE